MNPPHSIEAVTKPRERRGRSRLIIEWGNTIWRMVLTMEGLRVQRFHSPNVVIIPFEEIMPVADQLRAELMSQKRRDRAEAVRTGAFFRRRRGRPRRQNAVSGDTATAPHPSGNNGHSG